MAKTIECPVCGNRGNAHNDGVFELRGKFKGKAVRKCRKCGAALLVPLLFGRAQAIPADLWKQMEEAWDREVVSRHPTINGPTANDSLPERIVAGTRIFMHTVSILPELSDPTGSETQQWIQAFAFGAVDAICQLNQMPKKEHISTIMSFMAHYYDLSADETMSLVTFLTSVPRDSELMEFIRAGGESHVSFLRGDLTASLALQRLIMSKQSRRDPRK